MIVRTYRCNDCGHQFDFWHGSSAEDFPECPHCVAAAAEPPVKRGRGRPKGSKTKKKAGKASVDWVPTRMTMTGDKSRALDITQRMAEEEYGLSDMNDNQREGDIAAKMPVPSTAEREREEKARVEVAQYIEAQAGTKAAGGTPDLATNPQIMATRNAFFGGGMATGPGAAPMTAQSVISANPSGVDRAQTGQTPTQALHNQARKAGGGMKVNVMAKG